MINVTVNGKEHPFEQGTTVDDMLTSLNIKRERLAVELNRSIVPRTSYQTTVINEGDVLEIVSLVGGG